MKKTISLITAAALACVPSVCAPASVSAIEAATYYEYSSLKDKEPFPDPEASYRKVTENGFVYNVYEEYALLSDCEDTSITKAVIPETVSDVPVIGAVDTPFGFCHSLTSVELPDTFTRFRWYDICNNVVTKLGSTEEPMPTISEIKVSETNPNYTVSDGILYSKDMKTVIGCPPALDISELKISDKTETIGDYAFAMCISLENAIIPETVRHINNNAFVACFNLKSVSIPENITKISGDMFYYCQSLEDVEFRGDITTIGYGAFADCTALESFVIPDTVTCIGRDAFLNDKFVSNEGGVNYVGNWAVGSDENITEAVIKDGTLGIAEMTFFVRNDCEKLVVPDSVQYNGDLLFTGLVNGTQAVVEYHGHNIGERTFAVSKNVTDFYIYDPECFIADDAKTIPAEYKVKPMPDDNLIYGTDIILGDTTPITGEIVIHGYENSTAFEYAKKYNRPFVTITAEKGDVNGDGQTSVADLVVMNQWLLGDSSVKMHFFDAADLCKDGKLNVFDLIAMREMLAQMS